MDDKIWIFPAKEDAIGPIEDSNGKVLEVIDPSTVMLEDKKMFEKQKWTKADSNDYITLDMNVDGLKSHLLANLGLDGSSHILEGTYKKTCADSIHCFIKR